MTDAIDVARMYERGDTEVGDESGKADHLRLSGDQLRPGGSLAFSVTLKLAVISMKATEADMARMRRSGASNQQKL